jgi:hypothetical protein
MFFYLRLDVRVEVCLSYTLVCTLMQMCQFSRLLAWLVHTRAPFEVQEQLMCTLKFLAVIKSRKVVWWWQQNSRQQKVSLAQRRTGFNSHY